MLRGGVGWVGAGTCVSRKTIRSWVIKKSMPLVWLPPRSFISALWARKTYALRRSRWGHEEVRFSASAASSEAVNACGT